MMDFIFLSRLASLPTAPFYEHHVKEEVEIILKELFPNKEVQWKTDKYQNLIVTYKGNSKKHEKRLAYVVHMDHPAFHIFEGKAKIMGGLNPEILPGTPVILHGKKSTKSTRNAILNSRDKDGLFSLNISANGYSFATLDLPPLTVENNIIRAPVLDDLASVAMSLAALKEIVEKKFPITIHLVFHRAEEVSFQGAYGVASQYIFPKETLVYSVETSSYLAGGKEIAKVGGGIVLRTGDALTPKYEETALTLLRNAKKTFNGKIQEVLMNAGSCEASLYYALGYRAAGICLPLISWHNNGVLEGKKCIVPEGVHKDDFHNGTTYLIHVAKTLAGDDVLYKKPLKDLSTENHRKLVESIKKSFEQSRKDGLI